MASWFKCKSGKVSGSRHVDAEFASACAADRAQFRPSFHDFYPTATHDRDDNPNFDLYALVTMATFSIADSFSADCSPRRRTETVATWGTGSPLPPALAPMVAHQLLAPKEVILVGTRDSRSSKVKEFGSVIQLAALPQGLLAVLESIRGNTQVRITRLDGLLVGRIALLATKSSYRAFIHGNSGAAPLLFIGGAELEDDQPTNSIFCVDVDTLPLSESSDEKSPFRPLAGWTMDDPCPVDVEFSKLHHSKVTFPDLIRVTKVACTRSTDGRFGSLNQQKLIVLGELTAAVTDAPSKTVPTQEGHAAHADHEGDDVTFGLRRSDSGREGEGVADVATSRVPVVAIYGLLRDCRAPPVSLWRRRLDGIGVLSSSIVILAASYRIGLWAGEFMHSSSAPEGDSPAPRRSLKTVADEDAEVDSDHERRMLLSRRLRVFPLGGACEGAWHHSEILVHVATKNTPRWNTCADEIEVIENIVAVRSEPGNVVLCDLSSEGGGHEVRREAMTCLVSVSGALSQDRGTQRLSFAIANPGRVKILNPRFGVMC